MSDSTRKIAINVRTTPKKKPEEEGAHPVHAQEEIVTKDPPQELKANYVEDLIHDKHTMNKRDINHAAKLIRSYPVGVVHENIDDTRAIVVMPSLIKKAAIKKHEASEVGATAKEATATARVRSAESPESMRAHIPRKPILTEGIMMSTISIAYFCMEIGLENDMPTYAGGLGILAGDMMKSCADLDVAAVGVSLLYHKGYFKQRFDDSGWQVEEEESWNPYEKLILLPKEVTVEIEGRNVRIRAWLYKQKGVRGNINPVIFLDTDIEGNAEEDRHITDRLYSGDQRHRIKQEAVLGIGGTRMLAVLGVNNLKKFHMNEGHSTLLTIELYRKFIDAEDPIQSVRDYTVFTTHTPVAAGHDVFSQDLILSVLGVHFIPSAIDAMVFEGGVLNMTRLGMQFSSHINGVAKKHGEVTRELFPGYRIESITNGVYAREWTSPPFSRLFDTYLPGWQQDPFNLRYALSIPTEDLWEAHQEAKYRLIEKLNTDFSAEMNTDFFTIGFARRATAYKRAHMLFSDIDRLIRIADKSKGIQIIYAGKAHPADRDGKLMIQHIIGTMRNLGHKIRCVYVPDYDMELAAALVSGVDMWLNTPARPQEASGTSGMKAALNGVPQFSVLDGWWLEGHIEGVTGWSIGPHPEKGDRGDNDAEDIEDMYTKLEYIILPRFEGDRDQWVKMMRQSISINGSFFNTHRMVQQYVLESYFK